MPLARTEVLAGTMQELADFEDLVRSLDPQAWATLSRSAGWTVGDVCRHVTGSMTAIATGRFDDLVGPDATARQVAARQTMPPQQLADELHQSAKIAADLTAGIDDDAWAGPPPLDIPGTMGAVETIWYDTYLHGEDVRAALGQPARRGPGVRAAVSHIASALGDRSWGPATLKLEGIEEFVVGAGGGRVVTGDPLTFVLAATGRLDPAPLGLDATVNIYA